MDIYTIYVKTHLKTGLKYLGFTKKKDPYKYKGSGKYWTKHIKKHGEEHVWTNVIFQTEIKQEIKDIGLYYSELWNVVESVEWANMRPESGDGGYGFIFTPEQNSLMRKEWWNDIQNKKIMNKIHNSLETKTKKSKSIKKLWQDPEYKRFHTEKIRESTNKPENKIKNSIRQKLLWEDEDFKQKRTFYCEFCEKSIVTKGNWSKHLKSKAHVEKTLQ